MIHLVGMLIWYDGRLSVYLHILCKVSFDCLNLQIWWSWESLYMHQLLETGIWNFA